MNLLITGALGHIGSKLIYNVKSKFFKKIYLIDLNLNNNLHVIFPLKKNGIKFYLENVNTFNYKKKIKSLNYIVHLASMTNAENSLNNKRMYFN